MNRIQKIIGSYIATGLVGMVLGGVFVGSSIRSEPKVKETTPIVTIDNSRTVEEYVKKHNLIPNTYVLDEFENKETHSKLYRVTTGDALGSYDEKFFYQLK